ncbi:hypothetical protein ABK040_004313 [Willaertia magna]
MINILSEKSNLNTTQNYKFILDNIYNNYYYYNKLTTFEFNNLLELYFTKLILNKDKQLFLKIIRFYNRSPLIVLIILLYLEKFNFIESYIFKVLQHLFSLPKKIQIYNLIFTILLENFYFTITFYNLQFILLEFLSFYYKNQYCFELIEFNERIKYLLDNKLFDFNKKIIIADLDDGNCKDYIYKEYLKEDNLKIVWIEITTFELIERIRKVYELN